MSDTAATEPTTIVDVGIPTRDRPKLVCEAVEAVLAQTFGGWRLTISENGPGGGETEAALARYLSDPRISYSPTGEVVTGPENWSRLIQRGDAPYVALLHDDDLWDPGFLERRVDFLERHPECGYVFSGNKEIDATGNVVGESDLVLPEGVHPPQTVFPLLYQHNVMGQPSILVRRSVYEDVGPYFDPEFFPFWDYEMCMRLAARSPGGYLAVRDCSYRLHDVRLTFTVRQFGEAYLQIIERADAMLADLPEIHVAPRVRRRRRAQALLTSALDVLEAGDRRTGLRLLRKAVRQYPRIVLDLRFATSLAALVAGKAASRALMRARFAVHRRGLRLHRR
jgi:glycosyltransferase involved in cell wall biosynthesis